MKIRVQGETYESPEEVITAIGSLSATLEDMPESSPERADLERHIERLKAAVGPVTGDQSSPAQGAAEGTAPELSPEPAALAPSDPTEEPDEPDEEVNLVPPGHKLCPTCLGGGLLSDDAPVSRNHERCDNCNGYGKVLTGSHVAGHEMVDCEECQGNGYITARANYQPKENRHSVAAAPSWPGSWWNETESRWEPPSGEPPWTGAVWDHLKGAYA